MNGRIIVLSQWEGREAAALLQDGVLQDLLIAPHDDNDDLLPGAILRGVVDRPMKGQGGVFVKLPGGSGFMRQVSGYAPGQKVIVQVTGATEPGKAPPVSARVLFKSRFAIVTPDAPGLNISRRIHEEDLRAELQEIAQEAMAGADPRHGLIIRSAAMHADPEEIAEDIAAVRKLSEAVMNDLDGAPELLVDAPTPYEAAWRDWTDRPYDALEESERAFTDLGVLEMIDALADPVVPLGNSGTMVIEQTRALIAVDVNTGSDTSLAAGVKANIAAARDLPRQLRLRGLGGQVVIDFAPMPKKDRGTLEQVMRAAFKNEGSETTLAGWTTLGNFELQRKRDRAPLESLL